MPTANFDDLNNKENSIVIDETDAPIVLTGFAISTLNYIVNAINNGLWGETKNAISNYAIKKSQPLKRKIISWFKWQFKKLFISQEEINNKIVNCKIKKIIEKIDIELRKLIAKENIEEFKKTLNKIWKQNYKKFFLEAYKEEWQVKNLNYDNINIQRNKIFANKQIKPTRIEEETLIISIINMLKTLKTNKLAQNIVKNYQNLTLIKVNSMTEINPDYGEAFNLIYKEFINRLKNINIYDIILCDKALKMVNIVDKDLLFQQILNKDYNKNNNYDNNKDSSLLIYQNELFSLNLKEILKIVKSETENQEHEINSIAEVTATLIINDDEAIKKLNSRLDEIKNNQHIKEQNNLDSILTPKNM